MDIKGIARNIFPISSGSVKDTKGIGARVKAEDTSDRDGNGQSAGGNPGEDNRKRRGLSDEEIAEAVKYLEQLPGVKDHLLEVKVERNAAGIPSLMITDRTGKIVRRIPESEITLITANKQQKNGHLLNRAL